MNKTFNKQNIKKYYKYNIYVTTINTFHDSITSFEHRLFMFDIQCFQN